MSAAGTVTAIMAAKNAATTIEAALLALVDQPRLREVVVVDDGSTDDTASTVLRLEHSKITLIRLARSVGRAKARNIAAEAATGDVLAVADADDISLPHRLGSLLTLLKEADAVAVGGQVAHFEHDPADAHIPYVWPTTESAIRGCLARGVMPLAHPSMLIRADAFRMVGGYDPSLHWAEDLDLVTRLAERGRLAASEEVVLLYRRPLRDAWSYMFKSNRGRRACAGASVAASCVGAAMDATRAWLRVRVKPQRHVAFSSHQPADGGS